MTLDGEGTDVVKAPLAIADGVAFSHMPYPAPYIDYTSNDYRQGVLPTYDNKFNPTYETFGPKFISVPTSLHLEYTQPKDLERNKFDLHRVNHKPVWDPVNA